MNRKFALTLLSSPALFASMVSMVVMTQPAQANQVINQGNLACMRSPHSVQHKFVCERRKSDAGTVTATQGIVEVQAQANLLRGGLLIFASAVTYALYLMGSGTLIPKFGSVRFNSYAMAVATVGVFGHYLVQQGGQVFHFALPVYGYGLLMAVVATVIPSYLMAEGIRLVGAGNTAIIGSIGPISTILLAYIFLGETVSGVQLIGTAVVLAGILLITLKKEKQG